MVLTPEGSGCEWYVFTRLNHIMVIYLAMIHVGWATLRSLVLVKM